MERTAAESFLRNDLQSYFRVRADGVEKDTLCYVLRLLPGSKLPAIPAAMKSEFAYGVTTGPHFVRNTLLESVENTLEQLLGSALYRFN